MNLVMSKKLFIGIDNGVTGSIGVISPDTSIFLPTPVKKEQDYTKKKKNISRINSIELFSFLKPYKDNFNSNEIIIALECPAINPQRWTSSMSAIRALEATLNVIELLGLPFRYIDSKEWQRELLPKGIKGTPELKKASMDIGLRLFPNHEEIILKQKDADGILIAE